MEKRKPGRSRKPIEMSADTSLLSEEKKAELRLEAQERIQREREEQAAEAFLADEEAKARRGHVPEQELVEITLDLPEHSDRLVIDGAHFFHGRSYIVPRHQADSMRDTIARAWDHQAEIDGKNKNTYRKAKNIILSPVHGAINTSNLTRA